MENNQDKDKVESEKLIKSLSFCVIDLETTGGDPKKDKIIEIGLVKISNFEIEGELTYLINPEIRIPDFVQKLTSISQDKLKNEKKIEEVIDEIVNFIGNSILVAHNAAFDVPFLNAVLIKLKKKKLPNPSICTNLMTKYLIPEIMNSNLPYLGKLFKIPHKKAHRALEDAKATARILSIYLKLFIEKRIKKINHLYYPRKKFELDTAHFKKTEISNEEIISKIDKLKTPFVMIFKGKKGIISGLLPVNSYQENSDWILKYLNSDYETLTLKMVGTYYKSLLELNYYFSRIPEETQNDILEQLRVKLKLNSSLETEGSKYHDHFIIRRHLIPEQFVGHMLSSASPKAELIFRYPTHQKKLFQFISYNIKNKDKHKSKNQPRIHQKLQSVFYGFFQSEMPSEDYFIFSIDQFKKNQNEFKNKLNDFASLPRKETNFPIEHL